MRTYIANIPVKVTVDDDGYVTAEGNTDFLAAALPMSATEQDRKTVVNWSVAHGLWNDGHCDERTLPVTSEG